MSALGHTLTIALMASSALNPEERAPPPDVPLTEAEAPIRFSGRLRLGGSAQRLYSVPLWLAEAELGVGLGFPNHAGYLCLSFERGRSEFGLPVAAGHSSFLVEWLFGRLRVGVAGRLGLMTIERATRPDRELRSYSIGFRLHTGLDLLSMEDAGALFAELGYRMDYYDPIIWGGDLSLGFRWEP